MQSFSCEFARLSHSLLSLATLFTPREIGIFKYPCDVFHVRAARRPKNPIFIRPSYFDKPKNTFGIPEKSFKYFNFKI